MGQFPLLLPLVVVLAAGLIATTTDLRSFKVHNVLTLPLLLSGLLYHGLFGGPGALSDSIHGALLGFGSLFLFYLLGGMGGGDVKLMAGVGAWLGVPLTLCILVAASLAGGVYALVLIVATGRVRETWVNMKIVWLRLRAVGRYLGAEDRVEEEVKRPDRRHRLVPFAAMMMLGMVGLLLWAWALSGG